MQIPQAEYIEAAVDMVKKLPEETKRLELNELMAAMGGEELAALGLTAITSDLQMGYLLALETAREVVATSPTVLRAAIDPTNIL
jgi:hypothetical protein